MGKRFWQQSVPFETEIEEVTYSCPECGEVLLTIPFGKTIPEEKKTVTCSNGHKIKIPKIEK